MHSTSRTKPSSPADPRLSIRWIRRLTGVIFLTCHTAFATNVILSEDPETGLKGWKLTQQGIAVELIQRLPAQTRGFFEARGFPLTITDQLGADCFMQTIIQNTGEMPEGGLTIDLADWRVRHGDELRPLRLKADWLSQWTGAGVPQSAIVAFRWAMFPTEQTFEASDYNWGMTSLGVAPGEVVDLQLFWQIDNKTFAAWIREIECAPDR